MCRATIHFVPNRPLSSPKNSRRTSSLLPKSYVYVKTSSCRKLVGTPKRKKRYNLHYRNLKLYVRAISFTQRSQWLKPYIDFNTDLRKKATNEFEKDFFKLMNNSVFGENDCEWCYNTRSYVHVLDRRERIYYV